MKHYKNHPYGARTRTAVPRMRHAARGFSLVELMVAMVLGLLVATAAIGIFASHRATYSKTNAVDRLQEEVRTVFEMMAQDVRIFDSTVCRNALDMPITAASYDPGSHSLVSPWRGDWFHFVGGSDNVQFTIIAGNEVRVTGHAIKHMGDREVSFKGDAQFKSGDLVLICDNEGGHMAWVNQISGNEAGGHFTYQYKVSNAANTGAQDDQKCKGSAYQVTGSMPFSMCNVNNDYRPVGQNGPAFVVPLRTGVWSMIGEFVLEDGQNTFKMTGVKRLTHHANAVQKNFEEIVVGRHVTDLKFTYLKEGGNDYVDPYGIFDPNNAIYYWEERRAAWASVRAVRIEVPLQSKNEVGGAGDIKRRLEYVVSLRSHNP